MMRRYDSHYDPPAPMLEVTIGSITHSRRRAVTPALLDTGSDITAIPRRLAAALQLYPIGRLQLEDIQSATTLVHSYAVHLAIDDLIIPRLEVILTELDNVVLGRDVLNRWYVQLNGPELTFDIRASATGPMS